MTYYDERDPEWDELDKDGNSIDDPVLTAEQIRESRKAKLQEEIELLGQQEAELLQKRRKSIENLKRDPILHAFLGEVDERPERVQAGSLSARIYGIEAQSLIKEFRAAWYGRVSWLMKREGGALSVEEAVERANREAQGEGEEAETAKHALSLYKLILNREPENVSWSCLSELHGCAPDLAEDTWLRIKRQAREEFESGHVAAKIFEPNGHLNSPAKRAEYLAIRESFFDQWKPQGGLEIAMVENAVMCYIMQRLWVKKLTKRMETQPRMESSDYQNWKVHHEYQYYRREEKRYRRKTQKQWGPGDWDIPYVSEAEAVEQASHEADRWGRRFQASCRQLRDWRRWSGPVIVQNAEQINIASEGGQQVNVQKSKQSKGRAKKKPGSKTSGKRASKAKPKQLASKSVEESIRMETASDIVVGKS
jgi:hypothetical protein